MRRPSHGKILVMPISTSPSCIQPVIHLVQLLSLSRCRSLTSSSKLKWVADVLKIDRKKSKDERVYCPYCDVNNDSIIILDSLVSTSTSTCESTPGTMQCTLCNSSHAPFQCARAHVNGGIAKLNWARREKKLAADENREPDLRWEWESKGKRWSVLPPLIEAPPQEGHQQAQQEVQQPLCAATVMMHGPLPIILATTSQQLVLQFSKVVSGQKRSKRKKNQGIQGQAMIFQRVSGTSIFHLELPGRALWPPSCVM